MNALSSQVLYFASAQDACNEALKILTVLAGTENPRVFLESCNLKLDVENSYSALQNPIVVFDIDDTLLSGDDSVIPIDATVMLLKRLHRLGARIYLVTARHESTHTLTLEELQSIGISQGEYITIFYCHENYRSKPTLISKWKKIARTHIAQKEKAPILLTIGDQWSDLIELKKIDEFQTLEEQHSKTDWQLFVIEDGLSILGMKLHASY